jgi:putative sterol carrier protein
MKTIKELLESKVAEMNQNSEKRKKIQKWVGNHNGKVICFKTGTEMFHLVFERDKVTLREGNYSSCEFSYIGPQDVLAAIIQGKESAMKCGMSGAIKGWGSVNEAVQFEKLLI